MTVHFFLALFYSINLKQNISFKFTVHGRVEKAVLKRLPESVFKTRTKGLLLKVAHTNFIRKSNYLFVGTSKYSDCYLLLCGTRVGWWHRRRIKAEEKVKVVASVWWEEFIQFLAALAVLPRTILIIG